MLPGLALKHISLTPHPSSHGTRPIGQAAPPYESGTLLRAAELARHTVLAAAPLAPRRSVLQVGCGSGGLLVLLRACGWRVHGVEASSADCEVAHGHHHLPVHLGTLRSWLSSPLCRPFPMVLHLGPPNGEPDPAAFVRALHDATEPDGVLMVCDAQGALELLLADGGFDVVHRYVLRPAPAAAHALPGNGPGDTTRDETMGVRGPVGAWVDRMRRALAGRRGTEGGAAAAARQSWDRELAEASRLLREQPPTLEAITARAAEAHADAGHRVLIARRRATCQPAPRGAAA